MNISITKAEFEAIIFCKEQVVSQVEAASDEDFVNEANEAFDKIYSFEKKYYKAVKNTIIYWMPNRQSKNCTLSFKVEWRTDW